MPTEIPVTLETIREAAGRLAPWVHKTPVLTSRTLDGRCGGSVFFKCENFQKVGAFKFRGAMNALLQLDETHRAAGVVTHSSGNHGQALAAAGQILGIPVCVVMPRTAPAVKRAAVEGYGARVVACEPTLAAREAAVDREIATLGLHLVHPFDDWRVIAGQATAAWELMDQAGPLDLVVCPVGGGGLASGTALAVKGRSPSTLVFGAEPERADDAGEREKPPFDDGGPDDHGARKQPVKGIAANREARADKADEDHHRRQQRRVDAERRPRHHVGGRANDERQPRRHEARLEARPHDHRQQA